MTTTNQHRPPRIGEGMSTVQTILRDTKRGQMPQPYLLTPAGDEIVGNTRRPRPPLRLIRTGETGPACGYGSCSITPECTGRCQYQLADSSLSGPVSGWHTQRQAMPGEQQTTSYPQDENGPIRYVRRRHEWLILGGLLAVVLAAIALPVAAYLLTR